MDLFSLSSLPLVTCPVRDPSCCIVGIFLLGVRTFFGPFPRRRRIFIYSNLARTPFGKSLFAVSAFCAFILGMGFLFFQCPLFCSLPFSLVVLQRLTPLVLQIPLVYWLPFRPISEGIGLGEGFPVILVNVWGSLRVVLDSFLSFY